MNEHHLQVARTARYYTLGAAGPVTREVWIVCHGYAQLARYFLQAFTHLDDGTRLIVAPEALNRYYFETAPGVHAHDARVAATWMTREDREHDIADYVTYLDDLADAVQGVQRSVRPRLIALGFSQGAATVSRWAARGVTRFDHVVLWGAGMAPELEPGPDLFRGAQVTLAFGSRDDYVSPARIAAEEERLRAAGMRRSTIHYDGTHRLETDGLQKLAELVSRS
ncbi:esterase [soil metagenome]